MNNLRIIIYLFAAISLCGCQKFLDVKPNKQLATPSSAADLYAVMDAETISTSFPSACDVASDNYFLSYTSWQALPFLYTRQDYTWDANAPNDQDWQYGYATIESANIVLDALPAISGISSADARNIRGIALFFRGYTLAQLASVFTLPYNAATAGALPGMPVRTSSDITVKTTRAALSTTYTQIIADLRTAAQLLPMQPLVKTRPCKPAAYGALARIYLDMEDYTNALAYADSCLQLDSTLIDYNTLNAAAYTPFPRFGPEVIFHATSKGSPAMSQSRERIDTALYLSYDDNDLRKQLFFLPESGGYNAFKGDYSGVNSSLLFDGIATDEIFLIKAECEGRLGNAAIAANTLDSLLEKRWKTGTYQPYSSAENPGDLLTIILNERRKELVMRSGLRWADLRRLGDITPERNLNGQVYQLPPGDPRYAFLLPLSVVQMSGIAQNSR